MKSRILLCCFVFLLLLTGCQKKKETIQTWSQTNGGTLSWWIKRKENHQTPEVSKEVDLSKYDAYYVDPEKRDQKVIFLTFDCGYENGYTSHILDVLKKEKVPAAFFVTKPFIRENIKLVQRMKKEGHIVGNHTVHHKSMPSLSEREQKEEIIDCEEYCKEATGYKMDKYIRPPMGEYNETSLKVDKELGYQTIFWSMAYVDFDVNKQPGKDYVIQHFKDNYHNGAIPLMHNVSKSNGEALEEVLQFLKKKGYEFYALKRLSKY
ncbi:MAG: polysaccharide deacetylase family protein [Anaerostipes sp.]|nr:polysaccharide deacetylase family protein [Anaerostipes sp.]